MGNAEDTYRKIVEKSGYSDAELKGKSRKRDAVDRRVAVACVMRADATTRGTADCTQG